ncbi:MAG: ABC transporter permease [Lachnospiraceae bacterium]|nr:ABC transporter permease [Lachnospiraceae bacterium]
MRNLIKAEWFKLLKSNVFIWLLVFNGMTVLSTAFLLIIRFNYGFNGVAGNGCDMYTISMSYVLHHTLVGYVLTSVFLCGDFSNRVFGISLLSGYTRSKILLAKVIVLLIGLVCLFIEYVTLTTAVVTIGSGGFGVEINTDILKEMILLMLCGIAGCIASGSFMVLMAVVFKKPVRTIVIGMVLMYIVGQTENLTRDNPPFFLKYIYQSQMNNIRWLGDARGSLKEFSPGMCLAVMAGTFIISMVMAVYAFNRAELK